MTHVYKTAPAVRWQQDAMVLLRMAGFQMLSDGHYALSVLLDVHTRRQDIDACAKLTVDTISAALGVDDRCITALRVSKTMAANRASERLDVAVTVTPLHT